MMPTLLVLLLCLFLTPTKQQGYEGAGIQLFTPDRTKTLLVQGQRSGRWGWTKGHRDSVDKSWLETAIREVKEESGFVYGIHYSICNSFPQQWGKRLYWQGVTYLDEPVPIHNVSEHRNIQWVALNDVPLLETTKDVNEWTYLSNSVVCDF